MATVFVLRTTPSQEPRGIQKVAADLRAAIFLLKVPPTIRGQRLNNYILQCPLGDRAATKISNEASFRALNPYQIKPKP